MASRQRAFTDSDIARGISLRRCQSSAKGRTKKEDKAMAGVAVNQLDDNDAKDLLLDGISQSVKELQREHLHDSAFVIANDNAQLQRLCQHIDQVFLCGLYRREQGYWRLVNKMTRQEALHLLDHLPNVRTTLGKGRAWLYLSLNENVLESYLRALPNYEQLIIDMYSRESFLRDSERMFTLTTLITGLDFLSFELTVDSEHFDRYGLLPAATNCSVSFNYTTSSVEATTNFRAVHSPVREKSDPLAAANASGRNWERFRSVKGYLSEKLTSGGTSIPGKEPAAMSPQDESYLSQSLTSSISSLKSMASRWTTTHSSGLSRPDYKEIAAIAPGEGPASGRSTQPVTPTTEDVTPDSSAGVSDGGGGEGDGEKVSPSGSNKMTSPVTGFFRQYQETSSQTTSGVDITTSHPVLPNDNSTPMSPPSSGMYYNQPKPAVATSSSRITPSHEETDGPVTWSSAKKSSTSVDRYPGGSVEKELTASTEGSFTSSGTFKTKPTRRLEFGKDYVESVVTPSSGHEFENSVDDGDDDVEVIQLSRKPKKGKKKKKSHAATIVSPPKRITEEDEVTSHRTTHGSGGGDSTDGTTFVDSASRGMFASRLIEQQRQQIFSGSKASSTVTAKETTTTGEDRPSTPKKVEEQTAAAPSISEMVAASEDTTTAGQSTTLSSSTPPPTTNSHKHNNANVYDHTGATPSDVRQPQSIHDMLSSSASPPLEAVTENAPSSTVSAASDNADAKVVAKDTSSPVNVPRDASESPVARSVTPVKSIYDNFLSEAVSSSPVHDAPADVSSPEPVPVSDITAADDDIISSPPPHTRPNTSSFSLIEYEESDFAKSMEVASQPGILTSRPSETVANESKPTEQVSITEAVMSSRSPVADSSARPASTRSNLSNQSTHSRTSLSGDSQGRSSAPSPGSYTSSHRGLNVTPDAESSRLRRSSSRGNPSPAMLRSVSKNTTPSLIPDGDDGEKLAVVDLSSALISSAGDESDMLPSLQRTKEALLEERSYPMPERPSLSDAKANAHDMTADHNLQLMLSLKIFKVSSNESLVKMMRVQTSAGRGKFKASIAVISNFAFYIINMDGSEGKYNRELCFPYRSFDHIEISLSWQTMTIVCKNQDQRTLITGNEPVTRGLVKALIRAAQSSGVQAPRVDAKDRERLQLLERHIEGMENEDDVDSEFTLIRQPDAEFRVLRYSIVHWEQLDCKDSQSLFATSTAVIMEGPITYKQTLVGISYWKEGYAVLKNGTFFLYAQEDAETPLVFIQLWGTHCGGCRRLKIPDRNNCFEVKSTAESLTLSVEKEDDLMAWLQAICEVVAGTAGSTAQAQCIQCSIVITPSKLYCYQEDFWGGPLFLLSACDINEVTTVFVDEDVRTYCTVAFGLTFESGSWLLCFDCEYELGQFESALSSAWRDLFQIPLTFAPIGEGPARERARTAVSLVQSRFDRSDSVTRGRS